MAGLLAIAGSVAHAADMPQRPLPMPRAPVFVPFFSWNGFYMGINAGYGFGDSRWTNTVTGVTTGDFNVDGFMIGGTAGYNMQFGSAVFGIEGDIAWSDVKGSVLTACGLACETKNSWFGTIRGRLGYALDRFLPYVTAGGAFGDVQMSGSGITAYTENKFGWTVGAGIEYAFMINWTAKLEYLYADLGTVQCPATNCIAPIDATFKLNIVRAGLNYKF
jgi:outer membrane immunogenic protein